MRHEDVSLIAVGKLKYIKDNRFRIINQDNSEEWMLIIRSLKKSDEGLYECQVNASPMLRLTIYLNVVGTNPHYNFFAAKILNECLFTKRVALLLLLGAARSAAPCRYMTRSADVFFNHCLYRTLHGDFRWKRRFH